MDKLGQTPIAIAPCYGVNKALIYLHLSFVVPITGWGIDPMNTLNPLNPKILLLMSKEEIAGNPVRQRAAVLTRPCEATAGAFPQFLP